MKLPRKYWPFYLIIALSFVLIVIILFDWWPALRGGYGWRWPYVRPGVSKLIRILPSTIVIALYFLGLRKLRAAPALYTITWCFLGALLIPISLLWWWGDPWHLLFMRTASGLISGGFSVASKMEGVAATLQQWPMLMSSLKSESIHVALSLPGWPIVYYGFMQMLEEVPAISDPLGMALRPILCNNVPLMNLSNAQLASAWLGIAAPIWGALTIVPLYCSARLLGDEAVARKAIIWWPIVPAVAMFLGTLNTPTPLISMTIVYLLLSGLMRTGSGVNWRMILAGILTAAAISFSFAFIPLLLFAGLLALAIWNQDRGNSGDVSFQKPLLAGVQFGFGLLLVFLVYSAASGHTPLAVLEN